MFSQSMRATSAPSHLLLRLLDEAFRFSIAELVRKPRCQLASVPHDRNSVDLGAHLVEMNTDFEDPAVGGDFHLLLREALPFRQLAGGETGVRDGDRAVVLPVLVLPCQRGQFASQAIVMVAPDEREQT